MCTYMAMCENEIQYKCTGLKKIQTMYILLFYIESLKPNLMNNNFLLRASNDGKQ